MNTESYSSSSDSLIPTSPEKNTKYRVINLLGSGSFGTVTLVKDNKNNSFAMKKIKFEDEQEGLSTAVLREISILLELSHRNIVRLYTLDYYWEGNLNFENMLLLELIKRKTTIYDFRTYGNESGRLYL